MSFEFSVIANSLSVKGVVNANSTEIQNNCTDANISPHIIPIIKKITSINGIASIIIKVSAISKFKNNSTNSQPPRVI